MSSETIGAIMLAFVRQNTWKQAALARHCGVTTRTIRDTMRRLCRAGMDAEREEDPPHVYWSVPRGWFPGAVALDIGEAEAAARLLARLPQSELQQRLVSHLKRASPTAAADIQPHMEAVLATLEDASVAKQTVRMDYFSATRGALENRCVSVHCLTYGEHPRFLATCHRTNTLKWFRVDQTQHARVDPSEAFIPRSAEDVNSHIAESIDGFHGSGESVLHTFRVRVPESRWVVKNLPRGPFVVDHLEDGVRIKATTTALLVLARFVVGLGDAAVVESLALRQEVMKLAAGAMRSTGGPSDMRSVRAIRSTKTG